MREQNKKEKVGELLVVCMIIWGGVVLPLGANMGRDVAEAKAYTDDYFTRKQQIQEEKLKNSPENVIPYENRNIPTEVQKKPENVKKQAKTYTHSDRYRVEMQKIAKVAKDMGFTHVERLYRLAHCESRFDNSRTNKNKDSRSTTDRGIFQFNDYWHPEVSEACARDTECATKRAVELTRNVDQVEKIQWSCRGVWLDESYNYSSL